MTDREFWMAQFQHALSMVTGMPTGDDRAKSKKCAESAADVADIAVDRLQKKLEDRK